jgi:voltage-gated sodium channel
MEQIPVTDTELLPDSRSALQKFVESATLGNVVTLLILLNTFTISLQTYPAAVAAVDARYGITLDAWFDVIDAVVLAVFSFELLAKLLVYRKAFFRNGWNIFDGLVVLVSLLSASPLFAAFRILRVLRMLRLLSRIHSLQMITSIIFKSVAGCLSITLLMTLLLFVFSIAGHALYGQTNPELFGNLHTGMWTLFKVACFYQVEEVAQLMVAAHPGIYLFLIPYFIIMSFVVFNFFSGIVVYYLYEFSYEELRYGKQGEGAETEENKPEEPVSAAVSGITAVQYEKLMTELSGLRGELRALEL